MILSNARMMFNWRSKTLRTGLNTFAPRPVARYSIVRSALCLHPIMCHSPLLAPTPRTAEASVSGDEKIYGRVHRIERAINRETSTGARRAGRPLDVG